MHQQHYESYAYGIMRIIIIVIIMIILIIIIMIIIERFSLDCRKTKTKLNTLTNQRA